MEERRREPQTEVGRLGYEVYPGRQSASAENRSADFYKYTIPKPQLLPTRGQHAACLFILGKIKVQLRMFYMTDEIAHFPFLGRHLYNHWILLHQASHKKGRFFGTRTTGQTFEIG